MFIVINGFIPKDNDLLGNGGRSIKIACIPVGEMTKCTRTGYKRLYDEDGYYTCPQIPGNETKIAGEYYWENYTLCGSEHPNNKQFSLVNAYKNTILPIMEKIAEKESENGTCDVIFYEQENCAGCHKNEEYIQ